MTEPRAHKPSEYPNPEYMTEEEYVIQALAGNVVSESSVNRAWRTRWYGMIAHYDCTGYRQGVKYIWRKDGWHNLYIGARPTSSEDACA